MQPQLEQTCKGAQQDESTLLTIFHFNDVYTLEPQTKEPKGGAAYFNALLQRCKKEHKHHITLFSGDVFSPALLSTEFKGENMIKPLNAFGIDLACFGNHDLDYELEHVAKLIKMTNFPWLLSNVYDRRTGKRLADGEEYKILTVNGIKIGIFSLAEKEWLDTLYTSYKQICDYIPFIDFAERMVQELRKQLHCDMVIALTHMMKYNDMKLAKTVSGIDLILGGHDHLVVHQVVSNTVIVKSGCDFINFSVIKVTHNRGIQSEQGNHAILSEKDFTFDITLKQVNHEAQKIVPDVQLDQYITSIYQEFKERQEKVACFTDDDLDLRFCTIRKQQSPFLEFVVSIYRHQSQADCAMMNSGNFRMDRIIKAGPITVGTITSVISDFVVTLLVPNSILLQALENSVSMYPNLSGRYSSFSGLSFTWDCSKKPGQRLLNETVRVHDQPIAQGKVYKVAMHSWMSQGGDGYKCFKQCKKIDRFDESKINLQLIHDLYTMNSYLLDTFKPKYPGRYDEIEYQGRRCLKLHLPKPKNVKMIMSTGAVYSEQQQN